MRARLLAGLTLAALLSPAASPSRANELGRRAASLPVGSSAGIEQVAAAGSRVQGEGFEPARLSIGALDADAQLALALWDARGGALLSARERLDRLLAAAAGAPPDPRLERERVRIEGLRAARDAWLARLAAEGGRVLLERGGLRANVKVRGLEDGVLLLAPSRLDVDRVVVEELPVAELLGRARDLPAATPGWAVPYARLLGGAPRWERNLPEGDEADRLRADADDMVARLRCGRAAATLEELARLELDGSGALPADSAAPALERVRELAGELADEPLVLARRTHLRELAGLAEAALFDAAPVPPFLRGRGERTADGTLRLTYGFDAAEEIDDFELVAGALPDWHASMAPVPKAPEDSYMIVKQGAFFGDGQLVYRHVLGFEAPVRVRYQMRYVPRDGDLIDVGVVLVGLAWDGAGSFAAASEFGDVYVTELERGRGERTLFEGERVVAVNTVYSCEARLERDGEGTVVEAWREGSLRNELDAGALERGGVFLFVHSPRIVAFEQLSIEGRLDQATLAVARARWVEEQLAALGL